MYQESDIIHKHINGPSSLNLLSTTTWHFSLTFNSSPDKRLQLTILYITKQSKHTSNLQPKTCRTIYHNFFSPEGSKGQSVHNHFPWVVLEVADLQCPPLSFCKYKKELRTHCVTSLPHMPHSSLFDSKTYGTHLENTSFFYVSGKHNHCTCSWQAGKSLKVLVKANTVSQSL